MGYIQEPAGVDLVVIPMPLSEEDRMEISAIIAHYKNTGEMPEPAPNPNVQKKKKSSNLEKEKSAEKRARKKGVLVSKSGK
ncbi:MAG: hypothetical protein WCR52_05895 [Bacteroidota bacterium]